MTQQATKPREAADAITRDKLYINGKWIASTGKGSIDVINPSTEEVVGKIPEGTAADIDAAVKAAKAAFDGWAAQTPVGLVVVSTPGSPCCETSGWPSVRDGCRAACSPTVRTGRSAWAVVWRWRPNSRRSSPATGCASRRSRRKRTTQGTVGFDAQRKLREPGRDQRMTPPPPLRGSAAASNRPSR